MDFNNSLTNYIKINHQNNTITKILQEPALRFINIHNKFHVLAIVAKTWDFISSYKIIKDNNKQANIEVVLDIIDNAITLSDHRLDFDAIESVWDLVSLLHQLPTENVQKWQYQKLYNFFKTNIKTKIFDLEKYEKYVYQLAAPKKWVLSHNDLIKDNILIDQDNKYYLIDYDFATLNDPLFDVASFISESNLNAEQIKHLIRYAKLSPNDYQRVTELINYQNLLWCVWAIFMWENTNNEIFQEIANAKYRALK